MIDGLRTRNGEEYFLVIQALNVLGHRGGSAIYMFRGGFGRPPVSNAVLKSPFLKFNNIYSPFRAFLAFAIFSAKNNHAFKKATFPKRTIKIENPMKNKKIP